MEYLKDTKEIGKRLQDRRRVFFKTQGDFAEKLNVEERKTVGNWETGTVAIPIYRLADICNLLDCDLDYLFGKIEAPKNTTTDIMKETGLSQRAVEMIESANSHLKDTLNSLIENLNFWALLEKIEKYREFSKDAYPIEMYLDYGKNVEMRENSSINSINNRDLCLFQIQELIKIIAKDGANNG